MQAPEIKYPEGHAERVAEERLRFIESPSTKMAVALGFKRHIYEGTVPAHVKASRRRRNKAARAARRLAR